MGFVGMEELVDVRPRIALGVDDTGAGERREVEGAATVKPPFDGMSIATTSPIEPRRIDAGVDDGGGIGVGIESDLAIEQIEFDRDRFVNFLGLDRSHESELEAGAELDTSASDIETAITPTERVRVFGSGPGWAGYGDLRRRRPVLEDVTGIEGTMGSEEGAGADTPVTELLRLRLKILKALRLRSLFLPFLSDIDSVPEASPLSSSAGAGDATNSPNSLVGIGLE
jgi:hypothetical protein